ncbi:MerR family transcriptional regulator [Propionibacteriaceae bacterium Y2011]|uniref:MerR family transcriptional regulator n=1 Tax=Microlunatus sp. Y2014 TaxID=3418488 RepID=UPI003B476826
MSTYVTIGEFSRMTSLSVKALHHYHDIGLLEPAEVDAFTGYRRYDVEQVTTAQLIGRLRTLQMPLPEIRTVIDAGDLDRRDTVLREHLGRMESELDRTREVVASLRRLLGGAPSPLPVEFRLAPATEVVAVRDQVATESIMEWCDGAFGAIHRELAAAGVDPAGDAGATYAEEFFTGDRGEVVAFVPVADETQAVGGLVRMRLPAQRFAVALHVGSFVDFDQTYGALGSFVAEHGGSAPGPIRERYLVGPDGTDDPAELRTEVCWPVP